MKTSQVRDGQFQKRVNHPHRYFLYLWPVIFNSDLNIMIGIFTIEQSIRSGVHRYCELITPIRSFI